jgi:tetratricopeptide (TPR) repeat protein
VPEAPGIRTLVPADRVLCHRTKQAMGLHTLPSPDGFDATRADGHPHAWEGYFHLGDDRPFVAALDGTGRGLVETSTRLLRGRKMFAWGQDRSGRWWQDRLGDGAFRYFEIQAGLARTQVETVPMPARAEWSWTEAFGPLGADPAVTHGVDWGTAWRHAAARLEAALPGREVAAREEEFAAVLDAPPEAILSVGSGWGALEARRTGHRVLPVGTPFPDSTLGPDQEPWLALLETGRLPDRDPGEIPAAPMVQPEWEPLLAAHGARWDTLLHLGIMKMERADTAGAREAWEESLSLRPSAWALRNLAQLDLRENRPAGAADALARGWELAPDVIRPALARERLEALLAAGRPAEAVAFADSLPPALRDRDRIRLLEARAALAAGDRARAKALLGTIRATDLREGESALEDLRSALAAGETGKVDS